MMVSYAATSMALAIATGQSVVSVANLLSTVAFVFMIVSSTVQFSRLDHKIPEMLKSRNPTSTDFSWLLQKKSVWGQDTLICLIWVSWCCGVEYSDLSFEGTSSGRLEGWVWGGEWLLWLLLCGSGRQKTAWKVDKPLRDTFHSLSLNFGKGKCLWLRIWPAAFCFLRPPAQLSSSAAEPTLDMLNWTIHSYSQERGTLDEAELNPQPKSTLPQTQGTQAEPRAVPHWGAAEFMWTHVGSPDRKHVGLLHRGKHSLVWGKDLSLWPKAW